MKLTFFGAAGTTTGSCHLLEANGLRIMLDCGLYQGHRKEAFEKNRKLPVDARTVDWVILSHAHIDHSGNLPQLARNGFKGHVICRPATKDLCEVMLRDSCFLQMRDVEYVNKKRIAQGRRPFEPLYEQKDVDAIMTRFEAVPMKRVFDLGNGVTVVFHNAGHILGSAITQIDIKGISGGQNHRILFSGDLGQPDQPILRHYEYPQGADIIIEESTYADRVHPSAEDVAGRLKSYIEDIVQQKAKLLIPAFSVGRTQQILYYLNRLYASGRIKTHVPVYVDSPLSLKATEIYTGHKECYNEDAIEIIKSGGDPFKVPKLSFVQTPQESMALNDTPGPMIIIAASGMCEGGRVLHHLKNAVSDPRNIVLIVGFQAENTLGRRLVDYISPLKILGEEVELRSRVHTINALSAHADRNGLMDWFDGVKSKVRVAFAVHGEQDKVAAMVENLKAHGAPNAVAPVSGQSFVFE
jgi:metallo-beta-lactamase family protein